MTLSDPNDLEVKFGRDKKLEDEANVWLAKGVGDNDRSILRDAEKMSYEHGFISAEDLQHYDPIVDWKTTDSVYAIPINPADADAIESTICADVDDGNTRARNPRLLERQALMRHRTDEEGWGSIAEGPVPILGDNGGGVRKKCTKCGRLKGTDFFYAHPRTRDGLQSQCKSCQKS
jgi:hypothetical protein